MAQRVGVRFIQVKALEQGIFVFWQCFMPSAPSVLPHGETEMPHTAP